MKNSIINKNKIKNKKAASEQNYEDPHTKNMEILDMLNNRLENVIKASDIKCKKLDGMLSTLNMK